MIKIFASTSIAGSLVRYLFYALLTGAMALCVTWEAQHVAIADRFGESSLLEYLQVVTLLLAALSAYLAGYFNASRATLSKMFAAAACIACVREFDFALDRYLFDGAWQLLVFMILLIAGLRAWQHRDELKETLLDFMQLPSFGIMVGGFITVFVFSRLIGRQVLWRAIMGDGYLGGVKTAVEESTELLGYTLILIGTLEFLREAICDREIAKASEKNASVATQPERLRIAPIYSAQRQRDETIFH